MIGGILAFPLSLTGNPPAGAVPRLTHLALEGNVLLGSVGGASLATIFDAATGLWKGGGFFRTLSADSFYAPGPAMIDNAFMKDANVLGIGGGFTTDNAFYVEGYGYFTTGEPDMSGRTQEYFEAGIGPVGYNDYFSYSEYYTASATTKTIGLLDSSIGSLIPPDFAVRFRSYSGSVGSDYSITMGPGFACSEVDIFRSTTISDISFSIDVGQRNLLYAFIVEKDGFRQVWHQVATDTLFPIKTGGSAAQTITLTVDGVTTIIPSNIDATNYPEEAEAKTAIIEAITDLLP